jgi:predicted thioesterase
MYIYTHMNDAWKHIYFWSPPMQLCMHETCSAAAAAPLRCELSGVGWAVRIRHSVITCHNTHIRWYL